MFIKAVSQLEPLCRGQFSCAAVPAPGPCTKQSGRPDDDDAFIIIGSGKPCQELQDFLQKLEPEIYHKMLLARRVATGTQHATLSAHAYVKQGSRDCIARLLADALRLYTRVTSLDLSCNGLGLRLGESGGQSLAEALSLNTTLKSLDLCRERVGWEGMEGGVGRSKERGGSEGGRYGDREEGNRNKEWRV
jgi:hypothetical protein